MPIKKTKSLTLFRTISIYMLGFLCGVQIALYLYDYGIADLTSLYIGLGMVLFSVGVILFTYRSRIPVRIAAKTDPIQVLSFGR
jgi:hypothetical protein